MPTNRWNSGPHPQARRAVGPARLYYLISLLLISLYTFSGCKPNKRYDLIEAELRTRERELEDTRLALEQARNLNRAYAQQTVAGGEPSPAAPIYVPVKEIVLGRGTGGLTGDGRTEEGLMVVVVPRDEDGAAVKVPARLDIAAWDVTPAGHKNPIGAWDLPTEKVRPTWRSGFLSTGYFVMVPWQTRPCSERVRLAVRLTTLDGRTFETDRDIYVKPPGSTQSQPAATAPGPATPPSREPLLPDPFPPPGTTVPPVAPGSTELPAPKVTPERGNP